MSRVLAVINFIDRHGRPVDPDFGIDEGVGIDNTLPGGRPPMVWPPKFPPAPTDPEWGVGGSGGSTLPIFQPVGPDNTLPPVAGHKPVEDPPLGTIWPPLPPGLPAGKVAILVAISGLGYRYAVIEIPPEATPKD
jgi:hypothetical protein